MKYKVDGREYPVIQNPTMGEMRSLRCDFGVNSLKDIVERPDDPAVVMGLIYLAMKRSNRALTLDEFDALGFDTVELVLDDEDKPDEKPSRPTRAASGGKAKAAK